MRIILDTSLGIYCQVQSKIPGISFKGLSIIDTMEQKSYNDTLFRMVPRSTITR